MARLSLAALSTLSVSRHQIPAYKHIPNTSIQNHPLLIYHSCLPSSASVSAIESHLRAVDVVVPQWTYSMYPTTHFHSTTHEVLCVANGEAKLCFGHEDNPHRVESVLKRGDIIIIPAGVGHRLLSDTTGDFSMVGSYPKGKNWDMCYGTAEETEKTQGIGKLAWFDKDPLYGDQGPVLC